MFDERRDANNRVVTPIITLAKLPKSKAGAEQRSINPASELLHPREQRFAVDDRRRGLNDSCLRRKLHHPRQAHHDLAGHQAVRVQHDHEIVIA